MTERAVSLPDRSGSTVRGKYRIERLLARGSVATVYAATHRNGSRVALKILHPQLATSEGRAERFRREGTYANAIGHPGVVHAIDDDVTEDGCPFLVLELLEGETLEQKRVAAGGALPLPIVLSAADAVLDVLEAAHAKGVLHRNLKPLNVFFTNDGGLKVLDFGVAKWNDGRNSSEMTEVGAVLGTPAFMPPEQAMGRREEVDVRSDIWALGATMFVALTGQSVHEGGDLETKLIAPARRPARKLEVVAPQVPRAVAAVIDRALAFDKLDRWPDAASMREALRWARRAMDPVEHGDASGRAPLRASAFPTSGRTSAAPPPAFDDEPTVARMYRLDAEDLLTSGAPATARDPLASGDVVIPLAPSVPVFDLARKKASDAPPATPRMASTPSSWPSAENEVTEPLVRSPAAFAAPLPKPVPPPARPVVSAPPPPLSSATSVEEAAAPEAPRASADQTGSLVAQVVAPDGKRTAIAAVIGAMVLAGMVGGILLATRTTARPPPDAPPTASASANANPNANANANANANPTANPTATANATPTASASANANATPTASASPEPRRPPRAPRRPKPPPTGSAAADLPLPDFPIPSATESPTPPAPTAPAAPEPPAPTAAPPPVPPAPTASPSPAGE